MSLVVGTANNMYHTKSTQDYQLDVMKAYRQTQINLYRSKSSSPESFTLKRALHKLLA